jgi:hypothetical protein
MKQHPAIKSITSTDHKTSPVVAGVGHNSTNDIDTLGALLADIAALEEKVKPIKERVKAMGVGQHDGDLFRATVSDVDESESYDANDMEKKLRELGVTDSWFRHHKKIKAGYRKVLVKSR